MVTFRTTIEQSGTTATGIPVPPETVEALGRGQRVPITVTVGGHTYRSSVAPYRGKFMIALSAENRAAAGVAGGQEVEVTIEVDDAPRSVDLPSEVAALLTPAGRTAYDALSFSRQRALIEPIGAAKTDATRDKRIAAAAETLNGG